MTSQLEQREIKDGAGHGLRARRGVTGVVRHCEHPLDTPAGAAGEVGGGTGELVALAGRNGDLGAAGEQLSGDGVANATTGPGDEGGPSGQVRGVVEHGAHLNRRAPVGRLTAWLRRADPLFRPAQARSRPPCGVNRPARDHFWSIPQ